MINIVNSQLTLLTNIPMKTTSLSTMFLAAAMGLLGLASSASAALITFGADRDTTLIDFLPDNNYGGAVDFSVGELANKDQRSIVGFDVSALNGLYSTIDSITLSLTLRSDVVSTSDLLNEVYAISADNQGWSEATATWNNAAGGTGWKGSAGLGTAVTDYDSTLLASTAFATDSLPSAGTVIDFTFTGNTVALTALIDTWLVYNVTNSIANPGLLLLDPDGASAVGRTTYWSSEAGTSTNWPELTVNYTVVPEPGTYALIAGCFALTSVMVRRRR